MLLFSHKVTLFLKTCLLTKDCVCGIHCHLVLCGITNQPLGICERHVAWRSSVTLVIGDDFHLAMLEDPNAGIGGAQINPDGWSLRHGELQRLKTNFISHSLRENQALLFLAVLFNLDT